MASTICLSLALVFLFRDARAAGISVDAGLTPAEDRWIFRSQVRYVNAAGGDNEMQMYAFPIVAAYGLRNYLMVMARQPILTRRMTMMGSTGRNTGFGDLFVLVKYKAYRRNTPDYTLGISPTLGLSLPTGNADFTSDTWDLSTGLYVSGRSGRWATDLNFGYRLNGLSGGSVDEVEIGDEISVDWAGAYQFDYNPTWKSTIAPVLELSFSRVMPNTMNDVDIPDTGERLFYVSPGAKLSMPSVIVEALVQVPVWQSQRGDQLEKKTGFITGLRVLF